MIAIMGLIATVAGCSGSTHGPTAPTIPGAPTVPPGIPPKPTGPTYTISGVITEYRGGPVSGATVVVFSCNRFWGIPCDAQTDQRGHYSVTSPSAEPTALGVAKSGYQDAWKYMVSARDPTANFVLHLSLTVNAFGSTLTETIGGDEFMGGDDVLFGGLCANRLAR